MNKTILVMMKTNGFRPERILGKDKLKIQKGKNLFVRLTAEFNSSGIYSIKILKNKNILFHLSKNSFTGFFAKWENKKSYLNPCFKSKGKNSLYSFNNINNEFNRQVNEPQMWMSKTNKDEWLELEWDKEISINEIRLYFNPDLNNEMVNLRSEYIAEHHGFIERNSMPPELVKSYKISFFENNNWQEFISVSNNIKRMSVHYPEKINTKKIRIDFEESWGGKRFEVFEVRVY